MGDEFDGCECVWSHELAMRQLLALIRRSQDQCTDTECIDTTNRSNNFLSGSVPSSDTDSYFSVFSVLMIVALLMMFVRPESILNLTKTKKRRDPGGNGNGGDPPNPSPPAVN